RLDSNTRRPFGSDWPSKWTGMAGRKLPSNHVQGAVLRNSEWRTMQAVQRHTAAQSQHNRDEPDRPLIPATDHRTPGPIAGAGLPGLIFASVVLSAMLGAIAFMLVDSPWMLLLLSLAEERQGQKPRRGAKGNKSAGPEGRNVGAIHRQRNQAPLRPSKSLD